MIQELKNFQFTCDDCQKIVLSAKPSVLPELPTGWRRVKRDNGLGTCIVFVHLCPTCQEH